MAYISVVKSRQIRQQAGGRCEYCRCPESHCPQNFSVDHIWPQSLAGDDELENLALACQGCNNKKYNKTVAVDPVTEVEVALFHPRQQGWNTHFAWSEDELTIIGFTATGRAAIAALDLNRQSVVNLRGVLIPTGIHPPQD